jgi:hypothetical protein
METKSITRVAWRLLSLTNTPIYWRVETVKNVARMPQDSTHNLQTTHFLSFILRFACCCFVASIQYQRIIVVITILYSYSYFYPKMTEINTETRNELVLSKEDDVLQHSLFDSFMKAATACDKFFNCAYVKKQLEDEWQQEQAMNDSAVGRVWSKMDKSFEVEVYRQFLFDEASIGPEPSESAEASPTENLMSPLLYCGTGDGSIPGLQRTDS